MGAASAVGVASDVSCLQETGLYEYKVYGALSGCRPELCADVYMDLAYRKSWDKYVQGSVSAATAPAWANPVPCPAELPAVPE